jgi:hypothetical protein
LMTTIKNRGVAGMNVQCACDLVISALSVELGRAAGRTWESVSSASEAARRPKSQGECSSELHLPSSAIRDMTILSLGRQELRWVRRLSGRTDLISDLIARNQPRFADTKSGTNLAWRTKALQLPSVGT